MELVGARGECGGVAGLVVGRHVLPSTTGAGDDEIVQRGVRVVEEERDRSVGRGQIRRHEAAVLGSDHDVAWRWLGVGEAERCGQTNDDGNDGDADTRKRDSGDRGGALAPAPSGDSRDETDHRGRERGPRDRERRERRRATSRFGNANTRSTRSDSPKPIVVTRTPLVPPERNRMMPTSSTTMTMMSGGITALSTNAMTMTYSTMAAIAVRRIKLRQSIRGAVVEPSSIGVVMLSMCTAHRRPPRRSARVVKSC